jgi:hypothetical protein
MKGSVYTQTHESLRLHIAFGRSRDIVAGISPVTKLQARKPRNVSLSGRGKRFFYCLEPRPALETIQNLFIWQWRLFPQSG